MPYGLACALCVLQCLIKDVLHDILGKFIIAYIDNILIYSPSEKAHVSHVSKVLERLRENQLHIKGEKCKLHVATFLGYIISATITINLTL